MLSIKKWLLICRSQQKWNIGIESFKRKVEKLLPVSVIYGFNGKSNVLEVLHTLDAKILRHLCATCDKSKCEYQARKTLVEPEPFAFSEETKRNQWNLKCF